MRRWASLLLLAAACDAPTEPLTTAACSSSFDCAPGEACTAGYCLPRDPAPASPDAGAGAPDAPGAPRDGGVGGLDAGTPAGPPDSGVPPVTCPTVARIGAQDFCSIGDAIRAAQPSDVIDVLPGRFQENLDVDKSVTVRGAATASTTVVGDGRGPAVRITAANVVVERLTLDARKHYGVELTAGGGTLRELLVRTASGAAVRVRNMGTTVTLDGTRITRVAVNDDGFGHGVDLGPGTSGTLIASEISDTDFDGVVAAGATVTLRRTQVLRSGRRSCPGNLDLCSAGVWGLNGATVTIAEGSLLQDNSASGVILTGGRLTFDASSSIDNGGQSQVNNGVLSDGVSLTDGATGNVTNSVIGGNWGYAIGCWGNGVNANWNNISTNNNPNGDGSNC